MNADAVLAALADLVAERVVARLRAEQPEPEPMPEPYSRDALPPGASSWRAVLDAQRRGELRLIRVGRRAILERAEWERYLDSRRTHHAAPDTDELLAHAGLVAPSHH